MPRVICTLPNASTLISGVKFSELEDKSGLISDEIDQAVADRFISIPGYVLDGEDDSEAEAEAEKARVVAEAKAKKEADAAAKKEAAEKKAAEKAEADKEAADKAKADAEALATKSKPDGAQTEVF